MLAYLALFVLPPLWSAARPHGRLAAIAAAAVGSIIALFVGLRFEVGGDWYSYLLMFKRAAAIGLPDSLALGDPAYMLLNVAAARAGLGIAAVNLACAALLSAGLLLFSSRQPSPGLALAVAMPLVVTILAVTATRQATALGLVMAAFWALGTQRRGWARALLLAAAAFHWSAALLLPLALMTVEPDRRRLLLLGAAASILAAILVAAARLDPGFGSWVLSPGTFAGGAFKLFPAWLALALALSLGSALKLPPAERIILSYLAAVTLFATLLLPVVPFAADRLGYYTVPMQMIVFTHFAALLPRAWRRAAAAAVFGGSVVLTIFWFSASPYRGCITPYRSFISEGVPLDYDPVMADLVIRGCQPAS